MKNLKRFLVALAVATMLVACGAKKVAADRPAPSKLPHPVRITTSEYEDERGMDTWHGTIDGRECIEVFTQYGEYPSITCDWSPK